MPFGMIRGVSLDTVSIGRESPRGAADRLDHARIVHSQRHRCQDEGLWRGTFRLEMGIMSQSRSQVVIVGGLLTSLAPRLASADWGPINLTRGVTPISKAAYELHMLTLAICTVIALLVFIAIFYSLFRFRKSAGARAATWHHNTWAEVIWTTVPILILISLAVPATRSLIAMEDTANSELTIKVTGYQWRWGYEYLDEGISFYSSLDAASNQARRKDSGIEVAEVENYLREVDQRVVVPTNTKIRFLTTAADVIHSWWVPALGWKRDAIPGFITESWAFIEDEGVYRGQCAELCGRDHGYMPIVIEALSPERYRAWADSWKAEHAAEGDGE